MSQEIHNHGATTLPGGTQDTNEFIKGLWLQNPVFAQALGMCPVLAVTNSAQNGLAMGLATMFVLIMSNILVSSLRAVIPRQVRIACYILIIATFVTVVDYVIQAIDLELHKALGAFVSLIVVNCLILSRAEAFAAKIVLENPFWMQQAWAPVLRLPCSAWAAFGKYSAVVLYLAFSYLPIVLRTGSS